MKIPKIIHYCWFGESELPELEQKCIKTWKEILPDYTIKLWNEKNFDVNCCQYVKQAYELKKFAFVSDYARVYALYNEGGIYFDTDIEVLKRLDSFLAHSNFLGFENKTFVGTAVMAFEKGNFLMKEMLDYYNQAFYIDKNGNENLTTNVSLMNNMLRGYGLIPENRRQNIENITIYERNYFYPKKINDNSFRITDNSVTVHRMKGSWLTDKQKKRGQSIVWRSVFRPLLKSINKFIILLLGEDTAKSIELKVRNFLK